MQKVKTSLYLGMFAFALSSSAQPAFAQTAVAPAPAATPKKIEPVKELSMLDDKIGTGTEAVADKMVTVQYTSWLYTYNPAKPDHKGRQFESSQDRGTPYTFKVGAGQVIKGWDQGIVGMKVGGRRTLIIPPDLAYGPRGMGRGVIPPNAPIYIEVELLDVK